MNEQIVRETEAAIQRAVLGNKYRFVFNPLTGRSKLLTFKPDGFIGEGRNNNETRWRIANGRLEILNHNGALYSRFALLKDKRSFHHTNDPDTTSVKGQYLEAQ